MTDKTSPVANVTWNHHINLVANQHWPSASLYVVATPIGNLADFSLRAYEALKRCDAIAAEDTRTSKNLLQSWGINTPLLPAHRHNEHSVAEKIIARIQSGQTIALMSDAGAPAVSDPGAYIVKQVQLAGIRVVPIPGPSAVIAVLMASGATSDENPSFMFAGFVPPKPKSRDKWLIQHLAYHCAVVMFEAPHRIKNTCEALSAKADANRLITIGRELTKRFEEVITIPIGQLIPWLLADSKRQQGEFVLVIHACTTKTNDSDDLNSQNQQIMQTLLAELSLRDAVRIGVKLTGISRDRLYAWALEHDNKKAK